MLFIAGKSLTNKTKNAPKGKTREESVKKVCIACPPDDNKHSLNQFYKSYNTQHADGYLPWCKDCIQSHAYNEETHDIDIDGLKSVLRQVDRPYIETVLQGAINQYNKTYSGKNCPKDNRKRIIASYIKNINSLPQFIALDWQGGIDYMNRMGSSQLDIKIEDGYTSKDNDDKVYYLPEDDFEVTLDIVRLFGGGYKKSEYKLFWEKYSFLTQNYPETTNLHTEALVTYIRFKVKEEIATAKGQAADAEKWSKNAIAAAEKAKINPSQLSQSDLQGGVNSFSELFKAVEQAVDVIPILPKFKAQPNDALDFNIWCYVNYIRDLEGKPPVEYEDVYKFYDRRVSEYIEQYGDPYNIFTEDKSVVNRDKIKKFITLPKDYADGE